MPSKRATYGAGSAEQEQVTTMNDLDRITSCDDCGDFTLSAHLIEDSGQKLCAACFAYG